MISSCTILYARSGCGQSCLNSPLDMLWCDSTTLALQNTAVATLHLRSSSTVTLLLASHFMETFFILLASHYHGVGFDSAGDSGLKRWTGHRSTRLQPPRLTADSHPGTPTPMRNPSGTAAGDLQSAHIGLPRLAILRSLR